MAQKQVGHGHGGHEEHAHHGPTLLIYHSIAAALMVLLIITLAAAYFSLGPWNLPIAMAIAVIKALLVLIFFMHLGYSSTLVRFFVGAAFFWLGLLFIFTMGDYVSRHWFFLPPG